MDATTVSIIIKAQDQASNIVNQVVREIEGLGKSGPDALKKTELSSESLTASILNLKTAAAALFTGWAASTAVGIPATFEKFQIQLETITGSSARAEAAMTWIKEFTAKTPYELEQVTEAFTRLASQGFEPTEVLQTIGDTASSMGKSLIDGVEAFADAATGEFERLKEFGIRTQTAGDQVTFSWMQNGEQMTKSTQKTATDIGAALSGIWSGKFGEGMERQSQTWLGMLSNLKDEITSMVAEGMGAGPFDALKQELDGLLKKIQQMKADGSLARFAADAGTALTTLFGMVKRGVITVADFIDRWKLLIVALGAYYAIDKVSSSLMNLAAAAAGSKLGLLGLALAAPQAAEGYANLIQVVNGLLNPLSDLNSLKAEAARLEAQAARQTAEADAMIRQYAASLGHTVVGLEDFKRQVQDGTIKLKDQAGNVALTKDEMEQLDATIKKLAATNKQLEASSGRWWDYQIERAEAMAQTESGAVAARIENERRKKDAILSLADQTAARQLDAVRMVGGSEAQQAETVKQIHKGLREARIRAVTDWLDTLKTAVADAISQESKYAEEARQARMTTEEKIRDIQRQGMSESARWYDKLAEANAVLQRAEAARATGTADGFASSVDLAKKAQGLYADLATVSESSGVSQSGAIQTATDGVRQAGEVWAQAADAGAAAWKNTGTELQRTFEDLTVRLERLKTDAKMEIAVEPNLDKLEKALADLNGTEVTPTAAVQPDTRRVDSELDRLAGTRTESQHRFAPNATDAETKIAELKRPTSSEHTINLVVKGSGNFKVSPVDSDVEAYATGGPVFRRLPAPYIPGHGTKDDVPAMLMRGEYVVKKDAVQHYGPDLLNLINNKRLPVPQFASGGLVGGIADLARMLRRSVGIPEPQPRPRGLSPLGLSAVGRMESIHDAAVTKFARGGSLDEELADIALARARTQEDYDLAVSRARADGDEDLADSLADEQEKIEKIAEKLQEALERMQEEYEELVAEAEEVRTEKLVELYEAKKAYDYERKEKLASLKSALDESKKGGVQANVITSQLSGFPGGIYVPPWSIKANPGKKKEVMEAQAAYDAEKNSREPATKMAEFLAGQVNAGTDYQTAVNAAKAALDESKLESETEAAEDTAEARADGEQERARIQKDLDERLADLLLDYNRTMEDLSIREGRARANADEEKGYSVSGFSQWLAKGGLVGLESAITRMTSRVRRFAEGGIVPLAEGARRGMDSVPALLAPDEGVLKASTMHRLGRGAFEALNGWNVDDFLDRLSVHRFADGGVVPGGDLAKSLPDGPSRPRGDDFSATVNLQMGGQTYPTRTDRDTATALMRELKRRGASVR